MTDGVICALDIGSTMVKGAVRDGAGTVHARSSLPYPRSGDHDAVWTVVTETIRQLSAGIEPEAIVVAAQMAGLCLLDDDRRPLGPLVPGVDVRRTVGVMDTRRSGVASGQGSTADALLGVAPAIRDRAGFIGGVKEFVLERMTGRWMTDPASACATGLYDIAADAWSGDALATLAIPEGRMPAVHQPGEVVGLLTNEAAARCVLSPGIPVLCGLGDGPAASLSAGAVGWDAVCLSIGTTTVARLLGAGRPPVVDDDWFTVRVAQGWWAVGTRMLSSVPEADVRVLEKVCGRLDIHRVIAIGGAAAGRTEIAGIPVEQIPRDVADGTCGVDAVARGRALDRVCTGAKGG
ncbi:sugar (pentulose or hexulose) kinase [Microbacterium resistens]|uniref:Sugar (Pentulose or hexulose) kinase n=1 Tax=Microbacterium resistens TaxID=156977 RepID=A0ABU1SBB9_9MICO|nr:FGGY family carbohydrate kinase [Microbacterium resistens]MDR6866228.1 sugar (pentulose or hexulose) kinase [Microbacterium resistens]